MTRRQTLNLVFHRDAMILIASLVFLWFTISLLVDSNISKGDLRAHNGKITSIDSVVTKVKDKPLFKEVTQELRLKLDNEHNYFTSITTENFANITSKIAVGDTVTVFTKPKLWGVFGLKKTDAINHLTEGNVVIIEFSEYQQSISGFFILTMIASIAFFILFYVRTKRRYIFDILSNP